MREIKFRAWCGGRFHYVIDLLADGSIVSWENENGTIGGSRIIGSFHESRVIKTIPLMQYTGLKDENGREIYEGDVVEYQTDDRKFERAAVFWAVSLGAWGLMRRVDGFGVGDLLYTVGHDVVMVIGNIYENPELLSGA